MRQQGDKKLRFLGVILLGLLAACGVDNPETAPVTATAQAFRQPPDFAASLDRHLDTHPVVTAEDVYKFVHQSVAGPGHLVPSQAQALEYLQQEIEGLGESIASELLYEELGGEADLVRMNLRPYIKRGGDAQRLVEAMQVTAAAVALDVDEMSRRLAVAASRLAERGRIEESAALEDIARELAGAGYPALRHSDAYRAAYRPAYRVISRQQADTLVGHLPPGDSP